MEYSVGDLLVYGIHGVCAVSGIEQQRVSAKMTSYYVLEPVEQKGSRFLIPMHNQSAVAKLRPVISKDELDALLHSDLVLPRPWIEDENRRKQMYRELIVSGDRCELISMFCALHEHRIQQINSGRKVHICDDNFYKDAQKILCSEFSLVLGIAPGDVPEYIFRVMGLR